MGNVICTQGDNIYGASLTQVQGTPNYKEPWSTPKLLYFHASPICFKQSFLGTTVSYTRVFPVLQRFHLMRDRPRGKLSMLSTP